MKKIEESKPNIHLFICTNYKEDRECCASKGAAELRLRLKNWIKNNNHKEDIKVTASQCLGHCAEGIAMCLHTKNEWHKNVSADDYELITEYLRSQLTD